MNKLKKELNSQNVFIYILVFFLIIILVIAILGGYLSVITILLFIQILSLGTKNVSPPLSAGMKMIFRFWRISLHRLDFLMTLPDFVWKNSLRRQSAWKNKSEDILP